MSASSPKWCDATRHGAPLRGAECLKCDMRSSTPETARQAVFRGFLFCWTKGRLQTLHRPSALANLPAIRTLEGTRATRNRCAIRRAGHACGHGVGSPACTARGGCVLRRIRPRRSPLTDLAQTSKASFWFPSNPHSHPDAAHRDSQVPPKALIKNKKRQNN